MSDPHPSSQRSPRSQPGHPVTDVGEVHEIAGEVRRTGLVALDLEFLSESRYVPELCLVQVGWGDPQAPEVAAVDPHAADVTPLVALVEDPEVRVLLHSAQGDLMLLGDRFDAVPRNVVDTQVAAAFLGLGDQVGYANLVRELTGVELDKGAQFTDWCRRPLSGEQLRYALDDVRYLLRMWRRMEDELEERGRLGWVIEESRRVAEDAARRPPPEEAFRKIRGWERLDEVGRGALRRLAAWREREALDSNTPPSWLLKDRPLLEVARRRPEHPKELRGVRGVSGKTARNHGRAIVEVLRGDHPPAPEAPPRRRRLSGKAKGWGSLVLGLVHARCREVDVAPRFVASRADADTLVHWWVESGGDGEEPDLPLLDGWRRELAGQAALDWLAGQTANAADPDTDPGMRLVESSGE